MDGHHKHRAPQRNNNSRWEFDALFVSTWWNMIKIWSPTRLITKQTIKKPWGFCVVQHFYFLSPNPFLSASWRTKTPRTPVSTFWPRLPLCGDKSCVSKGLQHFLDLLDYPKGPNTSLEGAKWGGFEGLNPFSGGTWTLRVEKPRKNHLGTGCGSKPSAQWTTQKLFKSTIVGL